MTPNPLHVQGCELIRRLEVAIDSPVSYADLGYQIADEISAVDLNGVRTRFGVLLVHDSDTGARRVIVVIRGTEKPIEWVSDGIAFLVGAHFAPGCRVEAGFDGIYETFAMTSGKLIKDVLGQFDEVIVMGHSLGGPLATELAAQMGASELICYASPKPGDPAFGAFVRARVEKVTLYDFQPDIVPDAPCTFRDWLDRFNFVHVSTKTVLDPARCTPPIILPQGIESLEFAHALTTYQTAILTHP